MSRDRESTTLKIREAATSLLLREGFSGWGVNSIARAAGVDKVLVYRYFQSTDGLLEEIIRCTRFWPEPETIDDPSAEAFIAATIDALEQHPLWQLLSTLPDGHACRELVRIKSSQDLEAWLGAIKRNCSGYIPDSTLLCLPALIHFRVINRKDSPGASEIWSRVSPPLRWHEQDAFEVFEELPTELL